MSSKEQTLAVTINFMTAVSHYRKNPDGKYRFAYQNFYKQIETVRIPFTEEGLRSVEKLANEWLDTQKMLYSLPQQLHTQVISHASIMAAVSPFWTIYHTSWESPKLPDICTLSE